MENKEKLQKFKEIFTDKTKLKNTIMMIGVIIFVIAFSIYILDKQKVLNSEEKTKTTKKTSTVSMNNTTKDNTNKIVKSGKLSEIITANEYGDKVSYFANGIDDWKIFYNDNQNVFIISSKYISNDNIPTDTLGLTKENTHSVYWIDASYLSYNGPTDISSDVAQKYKLNWFNKFQSEFDENVIYRGGTRATAALLDLNVWNSFVDTKFADSAIGGPTLDMFIESWNQKKYLTLYINSKSNGYYISNDESRVNREYVLGRYNLSTEVNVSSDIGYKDKLYFPYNEKVDECEGYVLASPGGYSGTVVGVYWDGRIATSSMFGEKIYEHNSNGFRPVVCLKSDVKGTQNEDGFWNLEI